MTDWHWKPDKVTNKPTTRKRKKAKSASGLTSKQRDRKNARKMKDRSFCLSWFKRGGIYTDNVTLAILICNEAGWEKATNKRERKSVIRRFYSENRPRPERTEKKSRYHKTNKDFYASKAWKALRYQALVNADGSCCCCGAMASDGVQIQVDHIKPRSKYPDLELDLSNLQILCGDCNQGKDNIDETNWRQHWESI